MPSITHDCGAKLHFPREMAGRRGRCPTCGNAVDIPIDSGVREIRGGLAPAPKPAAPPAAPPPPPSFPSRTKAIQLEPPPDWPMYQAFLDGTGPTPRPLVVPANLMLKDEADAKWAAAQKKGAPSKFICAGCRDRLEVGALVCMKCGLDLRTGRTLDGKNQVNERGMEYLRTIPWLQNVPEDFDPSADDDDGGGKNKPRFPNLRKPRRP
jgi:hypothetical protein